MAYRWVLGISFFLSGAFVLPACGGVDAPAENGAIAEAAAFDTEEPTGAEDVTVDDEPPVDGAPDGSRGVEGDPRYIIFMQPSPTNPLFVFINDFIGAYPFPPNEAALLPPHVSMTSFFFATVAQEPFIRGVIEQRIGQLGRPFGQPEFTSVTRVHAANGRWVVRLNVKNVPRYHRFINGVVHDLRIEGARKRVANYHISLAIVPDKATADRIFSDAKSRFPKNLLAAFSHDPAYARWDIVLYRARDGIQLGLDQVGRWPVNP